MLQSFALSRYLESLGHKAIFIDHPCTETPRLSLLRCLVSRRLSGLQKKLEQYVSFPIIGFMSQVSHTRFCKTYSDIRKSTCDCEAFLVGSDQMWNPKWCANCWLPLVMLDFVPDGKKRISYAVSFGTNAWGDFPNRNVAGALLRKMTTISVREKSGLDLVQDLSGRNDAKCVIDPSLLFRSQFYMQIINQSSKHEKVCDKYIFKYILKEWDKNSSERQIIKAIQFYTGISHLESDKVRVVGRLSILCSLLGVKSKVTVSEWLSKIANASYVVTNSYHGVVFSIIFHRPFVAILLSGEYAEMNDRILSLLTILGLKDRAIVSAAGIHLRQCLSTEIDWVDIERRLDVCRKQADMFLAEALENHKSNYR